MTQIKTAISIRKDLYEESNAIAYELSIPRSQLIAMALEEYIKRYRNRLLRDRINQSFSTAPDDDELGSLEIIKAHQKRIMEDDEW